MILVTSALDAMGVVEYECSEGTETDNEYRDRWQGAIAFNASRLAAPTNAILRSTYINGYMSGRAIALTLPTSMESLFVMRVPVSAASRRLMCPPPILPRRSRCSIKALTMASRPDCRRARVGQSGDGADAEYGGCLAWAWMVCHPVWKFPDMPPGMLEPIDPERLSNRREFFAGLSGCFCLTSWPTQ